MPRDETEAAHAGQEVETAVESDGHDGQLEGVGELEGTAAEVAHVARETTGALGEDGERGAALQAGLGGAHGVDDALAGRFVDENEAGLFAGIAHEGNAAERLLHHPFELAAEEAGEEEDIERALVVGHEDVALAGLQVVATFDRDRDEKGADERPSPQFAGREGKPPREAEHAPEGGEEGGEESGEQEEGGDEYELIEAVEEGERVHFLGTNLRICSRVVPRRRA